MTAVAHLVRHGESEWNREGRIQGQSADAGSLTAKGQEDAARAGERLLALVRSPVVLVASDLPRAAESGAIIAAALGARHLTDPALREQDLGVYEGSLSTDRWGDRTVGDAVAALWERPEEPAPGGESVAAVTDRVLDAIARVTAGHPGHEIVVVCHGGPVRALLVVAEFGGVVGGARRTVANGAIESFTVSGERGSVALTRLDAEPRPEATGRS